MRAKQFRLVTLIIAIVIGPLLILGTGMYVLVSHEKVSIPIGTYVLEAYHTAAYHSDGEDTVVVAVDKTLEYMLSVCLASKSGEPDIISAPLFWLGPVEFRLWQCVH